MSNGSRTVVLQHIIEKIPMLSVSQIGSAPDLNFGVLKQALFGLIMKASYIPIIPLAERGEAL